MVSETLRILDHWPETPAAAGMTPVDTQISPESDRSQDPPADQAWAAVTGAPCSLCSLFWRQQGGVELDLPGLALLLECLVLLGLQFSPL